MSSPGSIRSGAGPRPRPTPFRDILVVRVFSPLLRRVGVTPELLTELNAINSRLSFVRLFWRDDTVVAATELLAVSLDPEELTHACDMLCDAADYYDERLHERFGGELAFDQRM